MNKIKEYIKKRENPVIFDKEGKFIYFPVNKVMQTTLARNLLKNRCIIYKDNPSLWIEYFEKTDFDNIYKFSIIRNPIDKFESAYNYLKKQEKQSKRLKIENLNINDFIKNIMINYNNPYDFNSHFERQYEGLYYDDKLLVDNLVKIENIEDVNDLCSKLGIENNIITNKTKHVDIIYTESIEILKKIYFNDFKYLYKFI
jgi:hypothetical protein